MTARTLDRTFFVLVLATLATWYAGESGAAGAGAMLGVLGLAVLKSRLVINDFMGLRRVRFKWKAPVLAWLALVAGLIMLTYWQGMQ